MASTRVQYLQYFFFTHSTLIWMYWCQGCFWGFYWPTLYWSGLSSASILMVQGKKGPPWGFYWPPLYWSGESTAYILSVQGEKGSTWYMVRSDPPLGSIWPPPWMYQSEYSIYTTVTTTYILSKFWTVYFGTNCLQLLKNKNSFLYFTVITIFIKILIIRTDKSVFFKSGLWLVKQ